MNSGYIKPKDNILYIAKYKNIPDVTGFILDNNIYSLLTCI